MCEEPLDELVTGVTNDQLKEMLHTESLFRLIRIHNMIDNPYMSDKEKIQCIRHEIFKE